MMFPSFIDSHPRLTNNNNNNNNIYLTQYNFYNKLLQSIYKGRNLIIVKTKVIEQKNIWVRLSHSTLRLVSKAAFLLWQSDNIFGDYFYTALKLANPDLISKEKCPEAFFQSVPVWKH